MITSILLISFIRRSRYLITSRTFLTRYGSHAFYDHCHQNMQILRGPMTRNSLLPSSTMFTDIFVASTITAPCLSLRNPPLLHRHRLILRLILPPRNQRSKRTTKAKVPPPRLLFLRRSKSTNAVIVINPIIPKMIVTL